MTKDEKLRYNREWARRHSKELSARKRDYVQRLHRSVIVFLGGRCANPNCRHLNLDGTLGCTDERLLRIDHPKGGGCKERRSFNNHYSLYLKILQSEKDQYRLLCASCNWLHLRHEGF